LRRGTTLLLDPVRPRSAPGHIRVQSHLNAVFRAEDLRQHQCILHGHTAALAHVRGAGVCGVSDQYYLPPVPPSAVHPLDRTGVELLVAFQGGKKLGNRPPKRLEAAPKAFQPPRQRIIEGRPADGAKPYVRPPPIGTSPK
jgi:hypothetical protein